VKYAHDSLADLNKRRFDFFEFLPVCPAGHRLFPL
jgi:hypothetical protein